MELFDQTITVTVTFFQLAIYFGIGLFIDWVVASASRQMARENNDPSLDQHGITSTLMLVPAWPFALIGIIVTGIMERQD